MTSLLCALLLAPSRPLMKDFIGLNTHTVQFKADLYAPATRLIRNYHPLDWDTGPDPATKPKYPMTTNGVNWMELYGKWRDAGYTNLASVMFESLKPSQWKDVSREGEAYGEAFARYFGPSGLNRLLEAAEIGNEPSEYSDAQYRTMFEAMARGFRKGDPKLKIATCAVAVGKADKYSKDVSILEGLEPLIDVLNVHTYSFAELWPTWRRSFPEDPSIRYLKQVQEIIDWRNRRAPGRQVWVTEFGYDSSTKPAPTTGDFSKWVGSTDLEQARYIVRSYLTFSAMDVDRAYLYWFNDEDKPQLHAASGLTRNYQPKPSFHAVSHLLKSLGDYRFEKALVQDPGGAYAFQYVGAKGRIVVAWSATGSGRSIEAILPIRGQVSRAEAMPTSSALPVPVRTSAVQAGKVRVTLSESPTYLWLK